MSRIAIDARELRTSTGRYIERLLHYLQQIDTQNQYFVLLKPNDASEWRPTNPNFTVVPCPYAEFSLDEQLQFAWQLYKLKVDLVHFGMTQQPMLYFKPSVTTMHDLTILRFKDPTKNDIVFAVRQKIYSTLVRFAARKSKRVITPSYFVKDDIVRYTHTSPDKFVVTHESADRITDHPAPVDNIGDKRFLLYVGRPGPHKNLDRLIDAFAQLQPHYPDLQLVMAGKYDARYQMLMDKVRQQNIPDVVFTGFVSDAGLRWLYEHATAYLFPSLSEGFGLPGLEAMQYGVPVISSNATCLPEIYQDAALYFDPTSTQDIANKITFLLENPGTAGQLIDRGQQLVRAYSWRRMAEQTLATYVAALRD